MESILSANWRASLLARSVWEFYNYQLYCTLRDDDGRPNRYRIDGITGPKTFDTIRIFLSIRNNDRKEAGLVHELLHANMIPLGYPRFWIDECERDQWRLAKGITNLADHVVMLPIYCSLGYSTERFLGPSKLSNQRERRVDTDIKNMAERLRSPQGYLDCVSQYLERNKIPFAPLYLANAIVDQRFI
jgi:hypothetical protein